ncbi:LexA-binding, inner membrane-associated putative hydrolase [Kineococcus xinjiangensis]|uniref:LexA-binding, inner membrane-associated putative hydrolase n=1 Tax=Kineococcus xinjiangensis TaxID=512762 RepID=A0A2S6IUX3_9ACTN|nr:metal-dependent hydrolase [Kineococcus xinjiangensis]PPK97953.1 LexA-binding, inner membrane-associated putative hydrolase [Kineococcus xinjiangensis]
MLGHSHATTGLAAGAALLPLAPVAGTAEQLAWVAAWGGFALLPDLDQGGLHWRRALPRLSGSTVATMWGPVTTGLSSGVARLARGHRQGTHDVLLAPLVFGAVTALASLWQPTAIAALALALGMALRACHVVIPGRLETTVVGNAVLSWGGAWWLTTRELGDVRWLPLAVAGGVVVHILGDWLTRGGVPVPFTWLRRRRRRVSLDLFRTGSPVEHYLIVPVAGFAALALVALHTGLWARITG